MKNRFLLVLISITLAIILGFGGMYLITRGIRSARAMMSRGEISVDLGTVNYLSAYYKMKYLNSFRMMGMNADDSREFWEKEMADGITYGEDFEEKFEKYLRTLIVAADTYHTDHGYTADDRIAVKYAVDTILAEYAEGSVSVFNESAKQFGFDYNDFQNAAAIFYKANGAMELIYGVDGGKIYEFPEICAQHFSEYSQVSLLFIRLDGIYLTDENGDYLYDAEGQPALRNLTDEEYAQRIALYNELNKKVADGNTDAEEFLALLEKSDGDGKYRLTDYYFHTESKITAEYSAQYGEVVSTALQMSPGEMRSAKIDGGVCFIFKHEISTNGYENSDNPFLEDFAKNAAPHQYEQMVAPFLSAVRIYKSYESYSPLNIPEINDFYIRDIKPKRENTPPVTE